MKYNMHCFDNFIMIIKTTRNVCDFIKAQSDNLPKAFTGMITDYFMNNECYNVDESSGDKR